MSLALHLVSSANKRGVAKEGTCDRSSIKRMNSRAQVYYPEAPQMRLSAIQTHSNRLATTHCCLLEGRL